MITLIEGFIFGTETVNDSAEHENKDQSNNSPRDNFDKFWGENLRGHRTLRFDGNLI